MMGLLLLATLSSCVLSLPVTSSQLENEDVKVMKCIVEVLTDVLSRPRLMPVSQECLVTLKTDDRLFKILRHRKFLTELQEMAVQGDHERAQLQRDIGVPTSMTQAPRSADIIADRSMLEALGGPGERSILSQEKRTGNGDGKEEGSDSTEGLDNEAGEANRGNGQSPGSHASESGENWNKAKAEQREEEEGEGASEEKRANSEESEEGRFMKGGESEEKRDAHQNKKAKKSGGEGDDEEDIKSALLSHKHENREQGEQEAKRGSRESLKHWTKRAKSLSLKRKAAGKEAQQEVPHHSKEIMEEEEGEEKRDIQRSPEEKELQMIARRTPEERRVLEEEGSASRKSEEPEIESLAAIESELENVAQKLHDLRRG
ncbi:chromogranin-A [Salarias fasciatus]|uniref:Chromogranin-A n=1 Tax=Salarias fasciatus TaxID=181472 RepID=A0A672J8E5_SALFA|nr:chromogranin-A [Salarias fasciatus]